MQHTKYCSTALPLTQQFSLLYVQLEWLAVILLTKPLIRAIIFLFIEQSGLLSCGKGLIVAAEASTHYDQGNDSAWVPAVYLFFYSFPDRKNDS